MADKHEGLCNNSAELLDSKISQTSYEVTKERSIDFLKFEIIKTANSAFLRPR